VGAVEVRALRSRHENRRAADRAKGTDRTVDPAWDDSFRTFEQGSRYFVGHDGCIAPFGYFEARLTPEALDAEQHARLLSGSVRAVKSHLLSGLLVFPFVMACGEPA